METTPKTTLLEFLSIFTVSRLYMALVTVAYRYTVVSQGFLGQIKDMLSQSFSAAIRVRRGLLLPKYQMLQ